MDINKSSLPTYVNCIDGGILFTELVGGVVRSGNVTGRNLDKILSVKMVI